MNSDYYIRSGIGASHNILMQRHRGGDRPYASMLFPDRSKSTRDDDVRKIQESMDAEVLEFLGSEGVVGYQLVRLQTGYLVIHVLYSLQDRDDACDNFQVTGES